MMYPHFDLRAPRALCGPIRLATLAQGRLFGRAESLFPLLFTALKGRSFQRILNAGSPLLAQQTKNAPLSLCG
jgi:hypothetical protein